MGILLSQSCANLSHMVKKFLRYSFSGFEMNGRMHTAYLLLKYIHRPLYFQISYAMHFYRCLSMNIVALGLVPLLLRWKLKCILSEIRTGLCLNHHHRHFNHLCRQIVSQQHEKLDWFPCKNEASCFLFVPIFWCQKPVSSSPYES